MYINQFYLIHSTLVNAILKQFSQLRDKETVLNGVYSPKWLSFLAPAFDTKSSLTKVSKAMGGWRASGPHCSCHPNV